MTRATARRELRADLARGMCSTCFAALTSTKRIKQDDHQHGCKLITDAGLPRPKDRFTVTARGIDGELRTVTFSLPPDTRDSVNEAAEQRLQARYGGAWTVVHCYWHNAPPGLIQTKEWNGR